MLTLTRKVGDQVQIGGLIEGENDTIESDDSGIVVTVVKIDRDKVRLRFTGPRSIPIMRTELLSKYRRLPSGGYQRGQGISLQQHTPPQQQPETTAEKNILPTIDVDVESQ